MPRPQALRCVLCGKTFEPAADMYTCPACGPDGTLDVIYDLETLKARVTRQTFSETKDHSLWRYSAILPVENERNIPRLQVGWTPLYEAPATASEYGVGSLFIKDDGRNPTASFKDRASAVGVAKALDAGKNVVSCASTGNAASSLAGFTAVAGLESVIFVPESAPVAKVAQLLVYGARVVLVKGDYADTFDLAAAAIEHWGWYNRNCAINPYLVEGKKTAALEIAEQMNWDVPDRVIIAVGDGCCISGLYKGFSDLYELGLIDCIPVITGVQAEGAQPICKAVQSGAERVEFGPAETLADSISVGAPRNWAKALRSVRNTNGAMVAVSDQEILAAIPQLARATGVFAEPAAAAAFAGFTKMARDGFLEADERVVVVVTGNGLKDIAGARRSVGEPLTVEPSLEKLVSLFDVN